MHPNLKRERHLSDKWLIFLIFIHALSSIENSLSTIVFDLIFLLYYYSYKVPPRQSYPQGTRVAKGNTVPCSPEPCRFQRLWFGAQLPELPKATRCPARRVPCLLWCPARRVPCLLWCPVAPTRVAFGNTVRGKAPNRVHEPERSTVRDSGSGQGPEPCPRTRAKHGSGLWFGAQLPNYVLCIYLTKSKTPE